MSLLTPQNAKLLRREKILRLWLVFLFLLIAVSVVSVVFMSPSYFILALSKDDVLRRLEAEEKVVATKEFKTLEEKIAGVNSLIFLYEKNEKIRYALAPILTKLANSAPSGISFITLNLERGSGEKFAFNIVGVAAKRDNLLLFIERLRGAKEFTSIESPISNLLKEAEASFTLRIKINPDLYK